MASFIDTPPTLSTWQIALGSLVLGGNSTQVDLTQVTGLGLPDVSSGDVQRPHDQGMFMGVDLMAGRTINISLTIVHGSTPIQTILSEIAAVTSPQRPSNGFDSTNAEIPFWICLPTVGTVGAMVRCRKRDIPMDLGFSLGFVNVDLELVATDPRLYSASRTITAASSITLTNSGNYETRPTYVVSGPTDYNWNITATRSGERLGILTIYDDLDDSGMNITIDSFARTLISNVVRDSDDPTNRNWRSELIPGSTWWNIPPSTTMTIAVSGGTVSAIISDAWML